MDDLKAFLMKPVLLLFVIGTLFLTTIGTICYFTFFQTEETCFCEKCPTLEENEVIEEEANEEIKVDIKGYVKNPGVYVLNKNAIVNDLLILAGGVKSGGTTDNINLSQKLQNEDSIVILSKSELKKLMTVTNTTALEVVAPQMPDTVYHTNSSASGENKDPSVANNSSILDNESTDKKVSINTATKEELMTLEGVGESKALKIIEYRENKKFTDITEIMNVSGIGESVYEKIKDSITL